MFVLKLTLSNISRVGAIDWGISVIVLQWKEIKKGRISSVATFYNLEKIHFHFMGPRTSGTIRRSEKPVIKADENNTNKNKSD